MPHLLLLQHILLTAPDSPDLVRRVLIACERSPGQRRIGAQALATLQARELARIAEDRHFPAAVELGGTWLPGVEGASALLLAFREVARPLAAITTSSGGYRALRYLDQAEQRLDALGNQILADNSTAARALRPTLESWRQTVVRLRKELETSAHRQLPNPFRTDPLDPEFGREVFRGRESLIQRLTNFLADSDQHISLALLGPRRCGKTTLLKMLPALLPDTVPIFFDLQDNPVDSPRAFFAALAHQARDQARRDRRLDLPPLPDGPPSEAGNAWFEALEKLAGTWRILLCIDEFERLEDLFPGDRRDLLRLMGLFRATIQHRRKLCLLVSGAAPFDELDTIWDDHFVNLRRLSIAHLDRPTALDLLTSPIPELPTGTIPEELAGQIFQRTGGQPMLLQLYGQTIINRLNDQQRHQATEENLRTVDEGIRDEYAIYYFRNIHRNAPPMAREAMEALALGETVTLEQTARRWLRRRCLINDDDTPAIPVMFDWLREELEG